MVDSGGKVAAKEVDVVRIVVAIVSAAAVVVVSTCSSSPTAC